MTDWRFRAFDVVAGNFLTDVPVLAWSGTDTLNRAGTFTADVLLDGRAAGIKTVNIAGTPTGIDVERQRTIADALATEPAGRTILAATRGGAPMAPSGIVWDWSYNDDRPGVLTVKGEGMLSFFDAFTQREDIPAYTNVDQLAIFRDLVARCQTKNTQADLNLTVHSETSGVLRTRASYLAVDNRKYSELLIELSEVINGFDFDFRIERVGDDLERHLRLWYPRRGRSVISSPDKVPRFRASRNGNATLLSITSGAGGFNRPANVVYGLGAGDGADMLTASATQSELLAGGWPGYTTTRAWKDVKRADTLQEHTDAAVERLSQVDGAEFTVTVDPEAPSTKWGSWDLGDDAVVIIDDSPLYPRQADGSPGAVRNRRIIEHRVSVDESGERFEVKLGKMVDR